MRNDLYAIVFRAITGQMHYFTDLALTRMTLATPTPTRRAPSAGEAAALLQRHHYWQLACAQTGSRHSSAADADVYVSVSIILSINL